MGEWIGRGRKARRAYGFDEIALVPGDKTIDPNEVDISWELGGKRISCKADFEIHRYDCLAIKHLAANIERMEAKAAEKGKARAKRPHRLYLTRRTAWMPLRKDAFAVAGAK